MLDQIAQTEAESGCELPGEKLDTAKMPGHWLLARLGKRVLRPGGLGLTRKMLSALEMTSSDHVVEFAPGLEPTRLIKDEGFIGAARFLWRVLCDRAARARVLAMRRAFRQHRHHLAAICIVARMRPETSAQ